MKLSISKGRDTFTSIVIYQYLKREQKINFHKSVKRARGGFKYCPYYWAPSPFWANKPTEAFVAPLYSIMDNNNKIESSEGVNDDKKPHDHFYLILRRSYNNTKVNGVPRILMLWWLHQQKSWENARVAGIVITNNEHGLTTIAVKVLMIILGFLKFKMMGELCGGRFKINSNN